MHVSAESATQKDAAAPKVQNSHEETELLKMNEELEKEVRERVGGDRFFASQVVPQIEQVRFLLSAGKVDDAEKLFKEIHTKVLKAEASHKSETAAYWLCGIELGFLIVLLFVAYCGVRFPNFWLWQGMLNQYVKAAWFGALGGVAVALYGLYSHVQVRDFDSRFTLWYLCKPVMGSIFGWFVYFVYFLGLISAQGVDAKINTPAVPYAIAFLAGFSERFTVQIIDKVMEVLTTWQQKPSDGPKNF
jgi:hypothetical protein